MHDSDWFRASRAFRASPILQNIHIRSMICGRKVTSELMEQTWTNHGHRHNLANCQQGLCGAWHQLPKQLHGFQTADHCVQPVKTCQNQALHSRKGGKLDPGHDMSRTLIISIFIHVLSFCVGSVRMSFLQKWLRPSTAAIRAMCAWPAAHEHPPKPQVVKWHGDLWKKVAICGSSNSNNNNNNQFSYLQKIRQGFATLWDCQNASCPRSKRWSCLQDLGHNSFVLHWWQAAGALGSTLDAGVGISMTECLGCLGESIS